MVLSKKAALAAGTLLLALPLSACSTQAATTEQQPTHSSEQAESHTVLHTHDTWAKAAAKGEMTAVFGELHNESEQEITVESVTSEVAETVEVHEVVDGKMQKLSQPLKLAAGESITLEPGSYHFMLMGLKQDLQPGDEVKLSLKLSDGSTFDLTAAAREFSGAEENYGESHDHDASTEHEHSDH